MNIGNFYKLSSKLSSSTFQAHPVGVKTKEGGIGDYEKLTLGDYSNITFPIVFKQEYGSRLEDILDTGTAILFLISDKMKTILEDNKITGWKIFPIRVYDKGENEVEGYHGLSITGRCGPVNYNKSEVIIKSLIEGGEKSRYYKGFYAGLDDWDGSDIFLSRGLFSIIVTQRVREIVKKEKLTNARFENLSEVETWEINVKYHKESISKNSDYF